MSILIQNGRIITSTDDYVADIYCADETITRIESDSDPATVQTVNLIATALSDGEILPAGFTWRDLTGAEVTVDEAQFKAFRNALAAHFVSAAKNAADHLAAVDALADAQAVIDYDFSAGWPANPAPPV